MDSLINSISFVTDPEAVDRLKNHIRLCTVPAVSEYSGWEEDHKKRAAIMLDLFLVAMSDEDLSEQEKDKFYEIGNCLDFDRRIVDDLFIAAVKIMTEKA